MMVMKQTTGGEIMDVETYIAVIAVMIVSFMYSATVALRLLKRIKILEEQVKEITSKLN
jgi:cell division protein FtsL